MSSSRPAPETGELRLDEPAPGVARLTISNPQKRGALDHAILGALTARLGELDARCVVITGEGRTFSAGYDLGNLSAERSDAALAEEAEGLIANPFAEAIEAIERYPYPIVAVLNGHAIGGGLELAVSCDLRIAHTDVKLGMPPAKLGLVYSHTGLRKFIDICGAARTKELFLTGRYVSAGTAHAWGLVNAVTPPGEHLAAYADPLVAEIAGHAPLAQRGNKRVIDAILASRAALAPDLERELIALRHAAFRSEDFREGVTAFAEKRSPRWQGR